MGTLPEAVSVDTSCPYMAIQDSGLFTLIVIFLQTRRVRCTDINQSWSSGCRTTRFVGSTMMRHQNDIQTMLSKAAAGVECQRLWCLIKQARELFGGRTTLC